MKKNIIYLQSYFNLNLWLAGLSFVLIFYFGNQLAKNEFLGGFKSSEPLLIPPAQLEKFTFGYNDFLADSLWIRSIQDFDFCGGKMKMEGYSIALGHNLTLCKKGWIFQMLDAVTRLDPRYQIVYTRGAVSLSVVVSDFEGAAEIFSRGARQYPEDWYIHYSAGYHYGVEMGLSEKAAFHLREAAKYGAPNWTVLLAAKMFNQAGKAEFGIAALKQFYKDQPYEEWPERAQQRMRELKASLDQTKKRQ
ncbi:MAG: hypothetical protein K1X29_10535 [Bdellovibrionales bacterium]|nr:hypothetical protein [Bdellovibrionales bacterium]